MKNTLFFFAFLFIVSACKKNELVTDYNEIPDELNALEDYLSLPPFYPSYERHLPNYLTVMGMQPLKPNDGKATIGRVLFYDKNLSADSKVSCASCHKQEFAFSDNEAVSTGIYGLKGTRNSIPLANVASFSAHYNMATGPNPLLLWDQRAANVAAQSTLAFLNDHEMGMTLQGVVNQVKSQPYYPWLWKKVYGSFNVNEQQILECLQEFVGAIGADNSLFDKELERANGLNGFSSDTIIIQIYNGDSTSSVGTLMPGITPSMARGRTIFIANCSKCHSPIRPLQEVFEACNGLDLDYNDPGKAQLTGLANDVGVFKAPSLRNIELTAPYMHDGRFATLEEVVDFYSDDVKNHPNLHEKMRHNGSIRLNLSLNEKNDLIEFLKTFTDRGIATDGRFSNPFKKQAP